MFCNYICECLGNMCVCFNIVVCWVMYLFVVLCVCKLCFAVINFVIILFFDRVKRFKFFDSPFLNQFPLQN